MAAKTSKKNEDHFTGQDGCEIHTSRSHNKCNIGQKGEGCDHQENCDKETVTWEDKKEWVWGENGNLTTRYASRA